MHFVSSDSLECFSIQVTRKVLQLIINVCHGVGRSQGRRGWPVCQVFAIPVLEKESVLILGLQLTASLAQRSLDRSVKSKSLRMPGFVIQPVNNST